MSLATDHSQAELRDLDTNRIIENLPDLYESSSRILKQLAPPGASEELVKSIVKDLQVPGSNRAVRLKKAEDKFQLDKAVYGTDNYIQVRLILRVLFKTPQQSAGEFRPDAILQAANMAILVKELLVAPKGGRNTYGVIAEMARNFPVPFISAFDGDTQLGGSFLAEQTFSMGLDLLTQESVLALSDIEENRFTPEDILVSRFIVPPVNRDENLEYHIDCLQNGHFKNILQTGPDSEVPNSELEVEMIKERMNQISTSFRNSKNAGEDLVDVEFLEEQFPWDNFLAKFVQWIRLRLDETNQSVHVRGGPKGIARALMNYLDISESQVDIEMSSPATTATSRELLPPPIIVPRASATRYVLHLEKRHYQIYLLSISRVHIH